MHRKEAAGFDHPALPARGLDGFLPLDLTASLEMPCSLSPCPDKHGDVHPGHTVTIVSKRWHHISMVSHRGGLPLVTSAFSNGLQTQ